jgi:hypothetical protein
MPSKVWLSATARSSKPSLIAESYLLRNDGGATVRRRGLHIGCDQFRMLAGKSLAQPLVDVLYRLTEIYNLVNSCLISALR